jgi:hypothetical protein
MGDVVVEAATAHVEATAAKVVTVVVATGASPVLMEETAVMAVKVAMAVKAAMEGEEAPFTFIIKVAI